MPDLYDADEAAKKLEIGVTTAWQLIKKGKFIPVKGNIGLLYQKVR